MKNPALISKIKSLDALTAEEKAELIALLNNTKKYGLVWEDKPEDVEELLRTQLPVLAEVPERRILAKDLPARAEIPSGNAGANQPGLFDAVSTSSTAGTSGTATGAAGVEPVETPASGSAGVEPVETPTAGASTSSASGAEPVEAPNHILIEGDNLHALTALTFTHEGKIDVMYFDPPYNTGNKDFKYNDRFVDREDSYRHSKWLSFMHKRLQIAKRLLSDKGVVFISVDDNEQAQLKLLCDEIFGSENLVGNIVVVNNLKGRSDEKYIATAHEYVLAYKKIDFKTNGVIAPEEYVADYKLNDNNGKYRLLGLRKRGDNSLREDRPNLFYPIYYDQLTNKWSLDKNEIKNPVIIIPRLSDGKEGNWRWGKETLVKRKDEIVIQVVKKRNEFDAFQKDYLHNKEEEIKRIKPKSFWSGTEFSTDAGTKALKEVLPEVIFRSPKPLGLINYCLLQGSTKQSIVLDIFAGSGTTLHATMQLNAEDGGSRQCILVTNNENNIAEEVCYERNRRVIQGYTNSKGQWVEGLPNNNFRYYKTEFVGSAKTEANRRKLTRLSTALLQIKEDCYSDLTASAGFDTESCHISANGSGRFLVVIYHNRRRPELIDQLRAWIKSLPETDEKIRMYAFSEEQEVLLDEFYDVASRIMAVPLPDAIYNAYRATFRTLGFDRKEPQQNGNPANEALTTDEMPELDFNQTEE